ncbi:MAG: YHS domain-containing protein [Acidobacteria bacterium]|nr:YHS domain-containing protein [Acidobacteriota bacterium]
MHKDPVCGMHVEEKDAAARSEFRGKTYYFCSSGCKEKFQVNPERYATETAPARS